MPRNTLLYPAFIVLANGILMVAPAYTQPTGYEGYQVVRIEVTGEEDFRRLAELEGLGRDFQVWSEAIGIGPVEVRVAPAAHPALTASQLPYQVVIEDLQTHIASLYRHSRDDGFFDCLRTYDEHVQFMTDLAEAYPALTEIVTLGTSVEGRPLRALRITGPGESKPGVMYHGAQHGNEQAGASVVAYVAHHLLANYDSDTQIATLVDNVEWFLLPIMNPDGYETFDRCNANGIDLNRNWGGPGSREDPSGGFYSFSEPETAALWDFFFTYPHVRIHIDFHGYVAWIMWPWGYTPDLSPDHWTFHLLGTEVHDLIQGAGGGDYEIGTGCTVSYAVSGGSMDYTYGSLGLWAFVFELVNADVPEICEEFLSSMLFLAEWISDCNHNGVQDANDIAQGISADCNANQVPDECESQSDCNGDGSLDICDFANEVPDCNANAVPDGCDIASGLSEDCTTNGTPDECEPDCNDNGVADSCDIDEEISEDCNMDSVPDECEPDCNDNGVADACDIDQGTSDDEDANDVPDECQLLIFVNSSAPSGGDGMSWATAYRDLQDALTEPAPETFSEIWVAAGTHAPAPPGGDRTATFHLVNGVAVYGGFVGIEVDLSERDPMANVTTLSGDLNADDGADSGNNGDNSYHVVTGSYTEPTAILDGFTITGGNANASGLWGNGGGMYNYSGSPLVMNCTFSRNSAVSGGAMYNRDGSTPMLVRCIFTRNSASQGGGMMNHKSSPTLMHCTFSGNVAEDSGAGLYNYWLSGPALINCMFSGNLAGYRGAGLWSNGCCAVTLINCVFGTNAALSGKAVACWDKGPSVVEMTNCILWNGGDEVWNDNRSIITIAYSDVAGGWSGEGNINTDPLFIDPDGGDDIPGTEDDNLRLSPGSPCIDAGDNTAVPADAVDLDGDEDTSERIPLDLDGSPRFLDDLLTSDTGVPDSQNYPEVVDMGAYEFPCSSDGTCQPHEDCCNCPGDCGEPPESEVLGSTCHDDMDNDCDELIDCDNPDCVLPYADVYPVPYGDGAVEGFDILCILDAANELNTYGCMTVMPSGYMAGDIYPCGVPDGAVEGFDILAVLDAANDINWCDDPCP